MKGAVTPFTEPLLELFFRALSDEGAEVQSNAAFATGVLVENSTIDLSPQYLHLLTALQPLFVVAPDAPAPKQNARDNAVGAVARCITRNTTAVPLDQVLPIFVEALPLQSDLLENAPVFRAIFHLFQTNSSSITPYMDRLLQVFAHVLDPNHDQEQVNASIRAQLIQLIQMLNQQDPAKIQAAGLSAFA